ncbi:hypothetical protein M8818_006148 [Zalaria obscura]|uniref:Uncharacterized protein n=1 Tax=Zalaria obscura TaxID=2024903 RepID=A0ACC3S8W1_9PEZI
MSRIPPIAPEDLTESQKACYDSMTSTANEVFGTKFVYKDSRGAFVGPFAALQRTPEVAESFFALMKSLAKIPGLPAAAREVAILAVGAHFQADYEIYSHERIAAALTELPYQTIDYVKRGTKPAMEEDCEAAYDAAKELCTKPGPLSEPTWQRIERHFGREGALALVHYVGFYAYTCLLLNGCAVPLPEGEMIDNDGYWGPP